MVMVKFCFTSIIIILCVFILGYMTFIYHALHNNILSSGSIELKTSMTEFYAKICVEGKEDYEMKIDSNSEVAGQRSDKESNK